MEDKFWKRAIELAKLGMGLTSPNPCVGALLVKDGKIVGEGWHQVAGGPHAEVLALEGYIGDLSEVELYVTLEPCAHVGKTPACADLIVKSGIRKVFIGMKDPFLKVNGQGVEILRGEGVEVVFLNEQSPFYKEIRLLNQPFLKTVLNGLPFVVLKAAISCDGKIAGGDSEWITCDEARADAKEYRSYCDCVLVGLGTVEADNCELASSNGRSLLRVIIDPTLSLGLDSKVFRDEDVFVACTERLLPDAAEKFEDAGVKFRRFGSERVDISALLKYLFEEFGVQSVFVEGGAKVHESFLDAGFVDAFLVYIAPLQIGPEGLSGLGGRNIENLKREFNFVESSITKVGVDDRFKALINFY